MLKKIKINGPQQIVPPKNESNDLCNQKIKELEQRIILLESKFYDLEKKDKIIMCNSLGSMDEVIVDFYKAKKQEF